MNQVGPLEARQVGDVRQVDAARVRRPVHEHLRRGRGRRQVEQPDDREHRDLQLAEPPDRGRVEHDRLALLELLRVGLEAHLPHERPDRLRGATRQAAPRRRPRSARRGRPCAAQSFASYSGSSRSNSAIASGRSSTSAPETPPQTQTRPETRSGYSSAVSSGDRPAARAADEHRPVDPGRVHHGDHVRAVGERHVLGRGPVVAARVVARRAVLRRRACPIAGPTSARRRSRRG